MRSSEGQIARFRICHPDDVKANDKRHGIQVANSRLEINVSVHSGINRARYKTCLSHSTNLQHQCPANENITRLNCFEGKNASVPQRRNSHVLCTYHAYRFISCLEDALLEENSARLSTLTAVVRQ